MALAAADVSDLMAQGRESAAVLHALLQGASSPAHSGIRDLAAEILRCCDRALAALHGGVDAVDAAAGSDGAGAAGRKRKSATGDGGATTQMKPKRRARASGGEMPARVEKKCTAEDGFMWRKYGQKAINNSNYPRLYFRCTYKHDSGCPATRQVQQSEDDPSLYVITYFGEHTCCGDAAAAMGDDDGETQPFVINFGSSSATATSGSPWFLASSSDDVRSETSRSSPGVHSPVEDGRDELQLQVNVTKVESTTLDSQPAAELSSSADVSCVVSRALDPLPGCSDWDYFGESSFYYISEFFNFDEISLLQ